MKAEKILQKIAEASERRPFAVVAVVIVLTIFMAFLATGVESQTDYEKMVPQDDPVIVALNEIRDEFGGTETVMLGVKLVASDSSEKVTDIRDPRVLELVDFLEQDIGSMDMVTSVSSKVDALTAYNDDVIPNDIATVKTIYQNLPESSQDGMFNDDYSMVVVYATTDAGTDDKKILVADINERLEEAPIPAGVEVVTTGTPALSELINRMMNESQMVTGLASLLAIFTILLLYFRNFVKSILPLIPVIVAVIWAAGSMAIFDIPMDTATSVMGSLLIGLGIDYGVHLYHRYEEELRAGKSLEESINIAVVSTGSAVLVTTATTMAGFAALMIAPLSMMANMGKVCTLGIFFCMAAVICLLPPLIVIEERYTRPFIHKLTLKLKGE